MSGDRMRHGRRWTRAKIIAAILLFWAEQGRPPLLEEWRHGGVWPSVATVRRHFGSWADAIEAATGARPRQGVNATRRQSCRARITDEERTERTAEKSLFWTCLSLDALRGRSNTATFYDALSSGEGWEDRLIDELDRSAALA